MALADPDDRNGDGISGVANRVERNGRRVLGRFGWKATMPDLETQTGRAASLDMGLSMPAAAAPAGDCSGEQTECLRRASDWSAGAGTGRHRADGILCGASGVPERRAADDVVMAGQKDVRCHWLQRLPRGFAAHLSNGGAASSPTGRSRLTPTSCCTTWARGSRAAMARGGPNGGRRHCGASAMTEAVSGQTQFLHDGRARNLVEAILWHGGEASGRARPLCAARRRRSRGAAGVPRLAVEDWEP